MLDVAQLNGVDFVPVPGTLAVYGQLGVRSVAPLTGPRAGGTVLELRGLGPCARRPSSRCSSCAAGGARRGGRSGAGIGPRPSPPPALAPWLHADDGLLRLAASACVAASISLVKV